MGWGTTSTAASLNVVSGVGSDIASHASSSSGLGAETADHNGGGDSGGEASSYLHSRSQSQPELSRTGTSAPNLHTSSTSSTTNVVAAGGFSIVKTFAKLLNVPSNRSCADCRSTLVDSSQIYASVSPDLEIPQSQYNNFVLNHKNFAPPGHHTSSSSSNYFQGSFYTKSHAHQRCHSLADPPVDPILLAPLVTGGHGVFVCASCAAAHSLLGPAICTVRSIHDVTSWQYADVARLAQAGGNARSWTVYEKYVSSTWHAKRITTTTDSSVVDRLAFIRAKYQALAFVLPPPGPLAPQAWRRIVSLHSEWRGLWGQHLLTAECGGNGGTQQQQTTTTTTTQQQHVRVQSELPDRLVDFFCVVAPSEYLDPSQVIQNLATMQSPEELTLVPQVVDCFPPQQHYLASGFEFPEHVPTFLFPEGCHPYSMPVPPSFFSFVLTCANGDRLYGGVLRVYDDDYDLEYLKEILQNSGYDGQLPAWLDKQGCHSSSFTASGTCTRHAGTTAALVSDMVFFPKCLVILSHYPFFDLWRKFLLQIYRISLVEAPLPIERFVANFCVEVPLPPPGKIRVKFGFTVKESWYIQRPADNKLPLANFSFQPLFACLSISNVLLVWACLLQEWRVALVSKHYPLLGPCAEALVSLLFPFYWEGMYLPVMPLSMLDILDAPVPYLVGLHSSYLQQTIPQNRPHGVIFVDLDKDVVHLGLHDDSLTQPRTPPVLPERAACKLRLKLEEFASNVYMLPPSGKVGTVTNGREDSVVSINHNGSNTGLIPGVPVPGAPGALTKRRSTDHINTSTHGGASPRAPPPVFALYSRREVLSSTDKAYSENELQVPITGFLSEHGHLHERTGSVRFDTNPHNSPHHARARLLAPFRLGAVSSPPNGVPHSNSHDSSEHGTGAGDAGNLLDLHEPHGFSSEKIRAAFLRFFVSIFQNYRSFLENNDTFKADEFVDQLALPADSCLWLRRMLKTQLFDRFIDERRCHADSPEVKFFDESIRAKLNRSKKMGILSRHRRASNNHTTSFLDDTSGVVTDTYTPPPPSNWGLPDDGRMYSYGTFPRLNKELFGKPRTPKLWSFRRGSSSRSLSRRGSIGSATSSTLQQSNHSTQQQSSSQQHYQNQQQRIFSVEQAVLEKAMAPVVKSGQTVVNVTMRGARNLEHAISALSLSLHKFSPRVSSVPEDQSYGASSQFQMSKSLFMSDITTPSELALTLDPTNVSTEDMILESAEQVVLNARRKQAILIAVFVRLQGSVRIHLARVRFKKMIEHLQLEQTASPNKVYDMDTRLQYMAAARLQAVLVRGLPLRRAYLAMRRSAVCIQACNRGRRMRYSFTMILHAIIRVQALYRRGTVRRRVRAAYKTRLALYKQHMVMLWQHAHTPLSYRTRFWMWLDKTTSALRVSVAEMEIRRIWQQVKVHPPAFLTENNADASVSDAVRLGLNMRVHCGVLAVNVHDLPEGSLADNSLSGNSSHPHHTSPVQRLKAERSQVYDRLTAFSNEGGSQGLFVYYRLFSIRPSERKKKIALSDKIWEDFEHSDYSAILMCELFPELQEGKDIRIAAPSKKKTKRRLSNHSSGPDHNGTNPGYAAAYTGLDAHIPNSFWTRRIHGNVKLVADTMLRTVPALMPRFGGTVLTRKQERARRKRQKAIMKARRLSPWPVCRVALMRELMWGPQELLRAVRQAGMIANSVAGDSTVLRSATGASTSSFDISIISAATGSTGPGASQRSFGVVGGSTMGNLPTHMPIAIATSPTGSSAAHHASTPSLFPDDPKLWEQDGTSPVKPSVSLSALGNTVGVSDSSLLLADPNALLWAEVDQDQNHAGDGGAQHSGLAATT